MEKKPVKIAELDVQPLEDEDLAAIAGASEAGSVCLCYWIPSLIWTCGTELE